MRQAHLAEEGVLSFVMVSAPEAGMVEGRPLASYWVRQPLRFLGKVLEVTLETPVTSRLLQINSIEANDKVEGSD